MKKTTTPYPGVRGLSPVRSRGLSPVRSFLLAILFLVLALTASATPLKWVCNWPESSAKTFSLYHGETATFEPSFVVNGKAVTNLAIDAVYYQTNGMDGAWWRLDNATFAPSNDCGAASYRFFVRAVGADGVNYRANGLLRMTDSPGFTPSEVTPPVRRLDFSTVELVNTPYYTKAETDDKIVELSIAPDLSGYATLEALASVAAAATNHTDSATNTIAIASNAAAIEANTLGVSTNAGNIARLESLLAAKADASRFTAPSNTTNDYWVCDNWGEELFFDQRFYDEYGYPTWKGTNLVHGASVLWYEPASSSWGLVRFDYAVPPYSLPGTISDTFLDFGDGVTVTRHNVNPLEPVVYQSDIPPAVSNVVTKAFVESLGISSEETDPTVPDWAKSANKPSYTPGEIGAASANELSAVNSQLTTVSAMLNAENARFVSTNYNSSTHMAEASVEAKVDGSWLVIWREMTRWNWLFDTYLPGNFYNRSQIDSLLDGKADRAWGFYDSHTGLYAPDGYTWISSPKIAIAGGLAYSRTVTGEGAIWVLESNGLVAELGGVVSNGFFRISDDDGNALFEIVKGDKRTVGASADSVRTIGAFVPAKLQIGYAVVAETHPTLRIAASLVSPIAWYAESDANCPATVEWSGISGDYVATVQAKSASAVQLFVKAEYLAGGETYVKHTVPLSAEGGILCTDGIHKARPVYSNGSIVWEVAP